MFISRRKYEELEAEIFILNIENEDLKTDLRNSYINSIKQRIEGYDEGYKEGHDDAIQDVFKLLEDAEPLEDGE